MRRSLLVYKYKPICSSLPQRSSSLHVVLAMVPRHPRPPPLPLPPLLLLLLLTTSGAATAPASTDGLSHADDGAARRPLSGETALDLTGASPHSLGADGAVDGGALRASFTRPQPGEPQVVDLDADALFAALVNHTVRRRREIVKRSHASPPSPDPCLALARSIESKGWMTQRIFSPHKKKTSRHFINFFSGAVGGYALALSLDSLPRTNAFALTNPTTPPPLTPTHAGGGCVHREVVRAVSRAGITHWPLINRPVSFKLDRVFIFYFLFPSLSLQQRRAHEHLGLKPQVKLMKCTNGQPLFMGTTPSTPARRIHSPGS